MPVIHKITSRYMDANPKWCGLYVRPIVERKIAERKRGVDIYV